MKTVLRFFGMCLIIAGMVSVHDATSTKPMFASLVKLRHTPILISYITNLTKAQFLDWFAFFVIAIGLTLLYVNRRTEA
jgi:uncharacterized protein YjeT (DUF2065 family)